MDSPNPYQSPPETNEAGAPFSEGEHKPSLGLEFESDWSLEGIQVRRNTRSSHLINLAMALLLVVWFLSIVATWLGDIGGSFVCLLTPIVFIAGALWPSSIIHRSGRGFVKACRGLCGDVRGRVDQRIFAVAGPSMCLSMPTDQFHHQLFLKENAVIRPPMITESLPIIESDIKKTWSTHAPVDPPEDARPMFNQITELTGETDAFRIQGELTGKDLIGTMRWWIWFASGTTISLVAVAGCLYAYYLRRSLKPWVIDPPPHYHLTGDESMAYVMPFIVVGLSLVVLVVGLIQLWRTRGVVGEFDVMVTPNMIVLGNAFYAVGYSGVALKHFRCSERGIKVHNHRERLVFMIPWRWFSDLEKQQATHLLNRQWPGSAEEKDHNYYVGPIL